MQYKKGSSIKDVRPKSDFLDPLPLFNIVCLETPPPLVYRRPQIVSRVNVSKTQNILRSGSSWTGGGVWDSYKDFETPLLPLSLMDGP